MLNQHTTSAFVLTCIDFRFHEKIVEELKKQGITSFDLKCDAGGVKYLVSDEKPAVRDWILENIRIAKDLHHIKMIVLINHYDCGAYGGSSAFDSEEVQISFQKNQLSAARTLLSSRFPDLEIKTFFAKPVGEKLELLVV